MFTRRNVWTLGTEDDPWHPITVAYARAVAAMQARPLTDPRSWSYQAAIHGLAGTTPPPGAPWNQCQHATWYFLPWHRMYLYQFERIVRSFVVAAGGPSDWALPYWNYELAGQGALPPAFRAAQLPDGSPNPLLVKQRRTGMNTGVALPGTVTSSSAALAATLYTTPTGGSPVGFGGGQTGFAHFGSATGLLENQPHNVVHVAVGGPGGLMTDPDTAALDPIFWLHHANIDRLWATWRAGAGHADPTTSSWRNRSFKLRDDTGAPVTMKVAAVTDIAALGYAYDSLPAAGPAVVAAATAPGPTRGGPRMARQTPPVMVGRTDGAAELAGDGLAVRVGLGPMPPATSGSGDLRTEPGGHLEPAAAGDALDGRRLHLELADIEGDVNPGVVYGVYVELPERPSPQDLEDHRVGVVSLFGIEHSRPGPRTTAPQSLRYRFDITDVLRRAHATGAPDAVHVTLLPLDAGGPRRRSRPSGSATPPVRIGTIAVLAG